MSRIIKQRILRLVERAGYVVTKIPDQHAAELRFAELVDAYDRACAAELETARTLAEADREFRLGRERDARELESARGETWAFRSAARDLQQQLAQVREEQHAARNDLQRQLDLVRQERQELHDRLAQTLDDNRRLKIRVEEAPEIDYQVLMRQQHEAAAFRDADPRFMELYERVKTFSMTSIERLYAMYKATEYICNAGVPGSVVEAGVWRGGSMMMAALTLQACGDIGRDLYLLDTFEGLPRPNASEDVDLWGHSAYNEWTRHRLTDESSDWAAASLDEVRANLASTGYPSERLVFIKGMVQKTLPTARVDRIALLRLDTDWYESTVCELDNLYPHVTENGVLIVDDYGHMRGQRKAVDEYFSRNPPAILLNRIDYSGRIGVKSARRAS